MLRFFCAFILLYYGHVTNTVLQPIVGARTASRRYTVWQRHRSSRLSPTCKLQPVFRADARLLRLKARVLHYFTLSWACRGIAMVPPMAYHGIPTAYHGVAQDSMARHGGCPACHRRYHGNPRGNRHGTPRQPHGLL